MHLHEYQAKEILERYGIDIPRGRIVGRTEDAGKVASRLGFPRFIVKSQVRTIERFAEGGIRFSASPEGVAATADAMFRAFDASAQNPSQRRTDDIRWLLIEEAIPTALQIYAAIILDPTTSAMTLLTSRSGGSGIEKRAELDPELINATPLSLTPSGLVGDFDTAAASLGLPPDLTPKAAEIFQKLAKLAFELDALQVEINPLALTPSNQFIALDAKLQIDDHALFRHPGLSAYRDAVSDDEDDPNELAADRHQLNYAALDGSIGIVVNGAGLALSTLDMLHDAGGKPANFMDIRTTATSLDIAYGVELVISAPRTKVLLVNVHGGGMQRCDTIAEGIAVAACRAPRHVPIIARFAGNNAEFASVRLEAAGLNFQTATTMQQAVRLAVETCHTSEDS
ncbi:MAG: ATP-grasp domain-containing protein [Filomicrobium sp.]